VVVISSPIFVGDLEVNWIEVRGNVVGFGLPASKDINPGRCSRGYKLRTVHEDNQETDIVNNIVHNILGLGFLFFERSERKLV
jgi:hypothetical protein